jgi:hypothetical protein
MEVTMIQRILGIIVGGVVTFLLLILFQGGRIVADTNTGYIVALVVGAVATFLWPIVVGYWTERRRRQKVEEEIEAEVQRQLQQKRQ